MIVGRGPVALLPESVENVGNEYLNRTRKETASNFYHRPSREVEMHLQHVRYLVEFLGHLLGYVVTLCLQADESR